LLAFGADFVEQDVAAVAQQLVVVHGGVGAGWLGEGIISWKSVLADRMAILIDRRRVK
jgi:hypothetical protein